MCHQALCSNPTHTAFFYFAVPAASLENCVQWSSIFLPSLPKHYIAHLDEIAHSHLDRSSKQCIPNHTCILFLWIIFHTSAYPFFFQLQIIARTSICPRSFLVPFYSTTTNAFFALSAIKPPRMCSAFISSLLARPRSPSYLGPFPLNRPECVRHTGLTKG